MLSDDPVQTDDPLLVTQFTAPQPPFGMIERPRLATLLRTGTARPVTLVCAPAGSGKTSLLSSVLGAEAAWLSLEPGDDVPERFWAAVLHALRHAGADLPSISAPAADIPPLLVNALAELPERVVLVLDDVHVLRARECLTQLAFLLLHMPPTLAVVLGTRADPLLPLHVLRVRGQLTEIRAHELAFTPDEATALLAAHDVELAEPLVTALCGRTEGWAAGLRLAALGLHGSDDRERYVTDFAGSDAVVGDYLVAEVLDRQPAKVRRFLLETSILDCVNGELADSVTGTTGGADTLDALERTNAFVLGLDRRRQWFRYHRLLATLLRARARRELGDELDERHRRAARWYAGHGLSVPALRHALEGGDPELGLEIIGACWFELLASGRGTDILALIDRLPDDRDPEVAAIAACAAFAAGDTRAGTAHLEEAREGRERGAGDERTRLAEAELHARSDADKRTRLTDAITVAELCAARAATDLDRASAVARAVHATSPWQAFAHACVGETALWSHELDRAAAELAQAVALGRAAGMDRLTVAALGQLALCAALSGDAGAVRRHAYEALALADDRAERRGGALAPADDRGFGDGAHAHLALALLAVSELRPREAEERLACARTPRGPSRGFELLLAHADAELHELHGRPAEALAVLDHFELAGPATTPVPYERAALGSLRARLLAALGDLDAAQRAFDDIADEPWLMVAVARAQLLLAHGDPAAAAEALEEPPHPTLLTRTRVERAVLSALALDQARDGEQAGRVFEAALALAGPDGHRWPFLVFRGRIERLLRDRIRTGTEHRAFVGELLDALVHPDRVRTTIPALLEPLTERERAILRFLPTRLSNNEISAELFISCNTVKTHLRSIYRKLDVDRRDEAVARARELNLLSTSRR